MELHAASTPSRGSPDVGVGLSPRGPERIRGRVGLRSPAVVLVHLSCWASPGCASAVGSAALDFWRSSNASFTWGMTAGLYGGGHLGGVRRVAPHAGKHPPGVTRDDMVRVSLWAVVLPTTAAC